MSEQMLPATPRRLAAARDAGNYPHSRLLTSAAVLLMTAGAASLAGAERLSQVARWLHGELTAPLDLRDVAGPLERLQHGFGGALLAFAGLGLFLVVASAFADGLQSGGRITAARLALDPLRGMRSGCDQLAHLLRPGRLLAELLHWAMLSTLASALLWSRRERLASLIDSDPVALLTDGVGLATEVLMWLALALLPLGVADYAWRWRCWARSLRMTPAEARDEAREAARRDVPNRPAT